MISRWAGLCFIKTGTIKIHVFFLKIPQNSVNVKIIEINVKETILDVDNKNRQIIHFFLTSFSGSTYRGFIWH